MNHRVGNWLVWRAMKDESGDSKIMKEKIQKDFQRMKRVYNYQLNKRDGPLKDKQSYNQKDKNSSRRYANKYELIG